MNIPQGRKIRVAFTLAAGTQVIDMAGPWEVFQDVRVEGECPFELYTVGATIDLLLMSGGMQSTMHRNQILLFPRPMLIAHQLTSGCGAPVPILPLLPLFAPG